MKKIFTFSLLLAIFLFQACKKEAEPGIKKVEINAPLAPEAEFRVALKEYIHDGEFPVITRPPVKYRVSRILYTDRTAGPVYQYISDLGSGESDKAIIKIVREHEHTPEELAHDTEEHEDNDDYTSVIITINFSIQ